MAKLDLRGVLLRTFPTLFGTRPATGYGIRRYWQPGAKIDYQAQAGNLWLNGVVASGLNWMGRASSEADWRVERRIGSGWEPTEEPAAMDLLGLLDNPNPWYDGQTLIRGLMTSDVCAGDGYFLKGRDNGGRMVGLVWVPHWRVHPVTLYQDSLIDGYEYRPAFSGEIKPINREDIVHVRDGINPEDTRYGLSRLAGEIRRVVADNEWSTWQAALALNSGSPGPIISPKASDANPPTPDQLAAVNDIWKQRRADARGESMTLPVAVEFFRDSWSPAELRLDELSRADVTRICAAMGFDPMVLGHESASKTYSNLEEALDAAGNMTLLPNLNRYALQIGRQVLPEFGLDPRKYRLSWDTSRVSWLRDETNELHDRVRKNYSSGVIDRYTAKEQLGLKPEPSDRGVYANELRRQAVVPDARTFIAEMAARTRAR